MAALRTAPALVTRVLLSKADATKENVSRSLEKLSLPKNYG
jgi:hypothetical protein